MLFLFSHAIGTGKRKLAGIVYTILTLKKLRKQMQKF